MLVTNKYLAYTGYIIFFASYILYGITLPSPLFGLEGEFPGSELIIPTFNYNIIEAIDVLVKHREYFAVFLLYIFTYVIPIGKLLVGFLSLWQLKMLRYINRSRIQLYQAWKNSSEPIENLKYENTFFQKLIYALCFKIKAIEIVRAISKYQFVDSFMAMFLVSHLMDVFVVVTILKGGYYFWSYCLCSLVAAQMISLGQIPVTKSMLWHHETSTYTFDPSRSNNNSKHNENDSNLWQFYMIYGCHVFTAIVVLGCFIYFFNSNILMIKLHLLDNWNFASSSLSGSQILQNLLDSRYFINGFLTYTIFVLIIPLVHMFAYISLHTYLFYKYIIYKKQNQAEFSNYTQLFIKKNGAIHPNFLFGKKENVNELDLFMFKNISSKKGLMNAIFFFDHIGDWAMIDVFCLSIIATWFTADSLPSVLPEIPAASVYNNFYMLFAHGFAGFTTVRVLSSFNHRLITYVDEDFDYYQKTFNICDFSHQSKKPAENKSYEVNVESGKNRKVSTSKIVCYDDLKQIMKEKHKYVGYTSYTPFFKLVPTIFAFLIILTIAMLTLTFTIKFEPPQSEYASLSKQFTNSGPELIDEGIEFLELKPMIGNCNPELWAKEYNNFTFNQCTLFPIATYNPICCFSDQNFYSPGACECNDNPSILDPVYLINSVVSSQLGQNTNSLLNLIASSLPGEIFKVLPDLFNIEFYQFLNVNNAYGHSAKLNADQDGNMHLTLTISIPSFGYHIGTKTPFEDFGPPNQEYSPVNGYEVVTPYEEFLIGTDILITCDDKSDIGPITNIQIADVFYPYIPLSYTYKDGVYSSDYQTLECLLKVIGNYIPSFANSFLQPYLNNDEKILLVNNKYYSILELVNYILNFNTEDGIFECPAKNPNATPEDFKVPFEDEIETNCDLALQEFVTNVEDNILLSLALSFVGLDLKEILGLN